VVHDTLLIGSGRALVQPATRSPAPISLDPSSCRSLPGRSRRCPPCARRSSARIFQSSGAVGPNMCGTLSTSSLGIR